MEKIIKQLLDKHHLQPYKNQIMQVSKPNIRLVPKGSNEKVIPMGYSKLGGKPDLPYSFNYPEYNGVPLSFIAQINCEQASKYDQENLLPKNGMLYFFYDDETHASGIELSEKPCWRVIYYNGDCSHLTRANFSNNIQRVFSPAHLVEEKDISFADLDSDVLNDVEWSDDIKDRYLDFIEDYWEMVNLKHQLLGHPKTIQLEVFNEVLPLIQEDKNDFEIALDDLILLLQIETDEEDTDMLWGDQGILYFVITKEDLKQKNFKHVWLSLQSY